MRNFRVLLLYKQKYVGRSSLILRTLELFAHEVCKFLKNYANFYLILLFLNVCKQTFHISHVRISQNLKGVLM